MPTCRGGVTRVKAGFRAAHYSTSPRNHADIPSFVLVVSVCDPALVNEGASLQWQHVESAGKPGQLGAQLSRLAEASLTGTHLPELNGLPQPRPQCLQASTYLISNSLLLSLIVRRGQTLIGGGGGG